jgi:hypothetical protein
MADKKQTPEFLGGAAKFNSVGRDTRGMDGAEEPVVPKAQTGYWLRIGVVVLVVVVLAIVLFYLNDRNLGKTVVPTAHGGQGLSPEGAKPTTDPNLK